MITGIIIYIIGVIVSFMILYKEFHLDEEVNDIFSALILLPWEMLGYMFAFILSAGSWVMVLIMIIYKIINKLKKK